MSAPTEQDRARAWQLLKAYKDMRFSGTRSVQFIDTEFTNLIAAALQAERERTWKRAIEAAKDELWSDAICEQYPHRAEQNIVTKCVIDALKQAAQLPQGS